MTEAIKGLTDRELIRWWRILDRRIREAFTGGLAFGYDWPTLAACHPHWARVLRAVQDEVKAREVAQ